MFDYSRHLTPAEVCVCLIDETFDDRRKNRLSDGIALLSSRYGFSLKMCSKDSLPPLSLEVKKKHIIIRVDSEPSDVLMNWARMKIQEGWSVSLAFSYPSLEIMLKAAQRIEQWKEACGDALNILRPDRTAQDGYVYVSTQKIMDNSVCDSVRIKYIPCQISERLPQGSIPEETRAVFYIMSSLYREYKMYHRSSHDGYFALRHGDGFYITATKTEKTALDDRRIVYVAGYDQAENKLYYQGGYLPSSDAVEASFVFHSCPNITTLFHTHASTRFTRNSLFTERATVPELPYGEPELGESLATALKASVDLFVIMKEHGEVFGGVDADARDLAARVTELCSSGTAQKAA